MPEDETLASPEAVDELSRSVGISKEALRIFLGVCWVAFGFNLVDKRRGGKIQVHLSWRQIPNPPFTQKKIKEKTNTGKGQKKVPIFLGFRSELACCCCLPAPLC